MRRWRVRHMVLPELQRFPSHQPVDVHVEQLWRESIQTRGCFDLDVSRMSGIDVLYTVTATIVYV